MEVNMAFCSEGVKSSQIPENSEKQRWRRLLSEVSAKPLGSIAGMCTENPLHRHHYLLCLQGTQLLYFHVSFPQLNLGKGT